MKRILGHLRRCVEDYHMISEGDKIAVGVSGGKDSLALLLGLHGLSRFYPQKFSVCGITIDMGFGGSDYSEVSKFCEENGIEYKVLKTDIAQIVFDERKEQNPCSLCSKMRRGALHDAAKELGCNKIALGHHFDDVVETFFLSLFYEGRFSCFSPVTYLDRKDVTVIRPMVYVRESDVNGLLKRINLPVVKSLCPADGNTKRQFIKETIRNLEKDTPGLRDRIFGAVVRSEIDGWKISEG